MILITKVKFYRCLGVNEMLRLKLLILRIFTIEMNKIFSYVSFIQYLFDESGSQHLKLV